LMVDGMKSCVGITREIFFMTVGAGGGK
jgi:hypothetical protein